MIFSLSNLWFHFVHSNFLIYNICWEDSDIDRKLLKIDANSKLLTITSAGCNVFNYLLDQPKSIHSIDINPKQTALLELKIALISYGDYEEFFNFFGYGKSTNYTSVYKKIRHQLTKPSQFYWDQHISFFNPLGKGLFYSGAAGMFAQYILRIIRKKALTSSIMELIYEKSQDKRANIYSQINQTLWSGFQSNLWTSPFILSLAGVPKSQQMAIGDVNSFMRDSFRNVFVNQKAESNYFWRSYIDGSFTKEFCPPYLKEENFNILKDNVHKIHFESIGIKPFLDTTNHNFTHINLLDHMDWYLSKEPQFLESLWESIINKSEKNATYLFRTAFNDVTFIPKIALKSIYIKQIDKDWIAKNDKVGTYTGTYLGTRNDSN